MGVQKVVPEEIFGHIDSFGSFSVNIFREVKTHKILKSSFLTRFCPQGTCGVEKLPWESFLCTIIVLTLAPTLTLTSSLGYFFDSGPLGIPKDTLVCWAAFL